MDTKPVLTFKHIGAARIYQGSIRIDIKTMMGAIPASAIQRLMERWPAEIFDISDIMKSSDAAPVGKAWIAKSGRAVIYRVNGILYVSSLEQIKAMIAGTRKYAGIAMMIEGPSTVTIPDTRKDTVAEVTA